MVTGDMFNDDDDVFFNKEIGISRRKVFSDYAALMFGGDWWPKKPHDRW